MRNRKAIVLAACAALGLAGVVSAADWTMWGRTPNRNMIAEEKNAPMECDVGEDPTKPGDGKNV